MNSRMLAGRLALALIALLPACKEQAAAERQTPPVSLASQTGDARRVLDLEGGRNFRDLGGYGAIDGKVVKWRVLFRSGSPAGLTEADMRRLDALGIRTVCDLRANEERAAEPNRWATRNSHVTYWTRDYALDMSQLAAALGRGEATPERTRAAMIGLYRHLPEEQAQSYAAMFGQLARGKVPLAFNCSAGKDRTGLAAALILHALGVPRATILADYALSDDIVDYRAALAQDAMHSESAARMARMPWPVVEPLMASDPAYLKAAFAAIEKEYGDVDTYLADRLRVTPAMLAAMRAQLLEPA